MSYISKTFLFIPFAVINDKSFVVDVKILYRKIYENDITFIHKTSYINRWLCVEGDLNFSFIRCAFIACTTTQTFYYNLFFFFFLIHSIECECVYLLYFHLYPSCYDLKRVLYESTSRVAFIHVRSTHLAFR